MKYRHRILPLACLVTLLLLQAAAGQDGISVGQPPGTASPGTASPGTEKPGIEMTITDPPGSATAPVQEQKPEDAKEVATTVKVEESKFDLEQKDGKTATLILAKIYDMKKAFGNSYVLHVDGHPKATVIDPGYNGQAIFRYCQKNKLEPDAILLTNGYFVRFADTRNMRNEWPDVKIGIGKGDAAMLTNVQLNESSKFGDGIISPPADVEFEGGETITTSGLIPWTVLPTPGHTPGSVCYQLDTKQKCVIFTGDFIYRDGLSNINLPESNGQVLKDSLTAFLKNEPADALIYPGFGPNTTVKEFYAKFEAGVKKANESAATTTTTTSGDETSDDTSQDTSQAEIPAQAPSQNSVVYQTEYSDVYPCTSYEYDDMYYPDWPALGFAIWDWASWPGWWSGPIPPPPPPFPPGPGPGPWPHPPGPGPWPPGPHPPGPPGPHPPGPPGPHPPGPPGPPGPHPGGGMRPGGDIPSRGPFPRPGEGGGVGPGPHPGGGGVGPGPWPKPPGEGMRPGGDMASRGPFPRPGTGGMGGVNLPDHGIHIGGNAFHPGGVGPRVMTPAIGGGAFHGPMDRPAPFVSHMNPAPFSSFGRGAPGNVIHSMPAGGFGGFHGGGFGGGGFHGGGFGGGGFHGGGFHR